MATLIYPDWRWGMKLTPDRLTALQPGSVVKQTLESVTSSTTYQDDNELAFPAEANAHYFVMAVLGVDGATGGDIKTRWSVPASATGFRWCMGPPAGSADRENTNLVSAVHGFTTDRAYGTVAASGASIAAREYLRVLTAGTAGAVTLQWAQNTSSATATAVIAGSYLIWWRVA